MTARRDFLRGLVTLPMIGGGVTLIGQPSAVAVTPTPDLLEAYKTWLDNERRHLSWNMAADPACQHRYAGRAPRNHEERAVLAKAIDRTYGCGTPVWKFEHDAPSPFHRAALVLSAVGCDWREEPGAPGTS